MNMITTLLPRGFAVRTPTMGDAEAVTNVISADEVALYGKSETTLEEVLTYWQEPGFSMATDAWVVLSPEGQVVAAASVDHREHSRLFTSGDVHPEYRGRGIGTYLLRLTEMRALEHIPLAPQGVRVTLNTSVSNLDAGSQRLLEKQDFKLVRQSWRMAIELNGAPPTAQWADGITVRTMAPGMERAVFEADQDAFQDHWGFMPREFEEWEHWTVKREGFDPSLWFLAMDGDEIVGVSLCKDEKESGGWVHDLGVRRPWRRKSVGLALLYHSFAEFYRRGIHNVYLGVDAQSLTGATRLYERAGMHVVRQYNNYEKELRAGKEPSTQSVDV